MKTNIEPAIKRIILCSVSATLSAVTEVLSSISKPLVRAPVRQYLQASLVKKITEPNLSLNVLLTEREKSCLKPRRRKRKTSSVYPNLKKISIQNLNDSNTNCGDTEKLITIPELEHSQFDENLLALHKAELEQLSLHFEFGEHFQISPSSFQVIIDKVGPHLSSSKSGKQSYRLMNYAQKLKISLWCITSQLSFREIGKRFDMASGTVHYLFGEFCNAVVKIASTLIKWPTKEEMTEIGKAFHQEYNIPGIVGVLHHSFFTTSIKLENQCETTRSKKKPDPSVFLQAVLDYKGQFIDVFTAYPAMKEDHIELFNLSPLCISINELIPDNSFLIVNENYPQMSKLYTPYENQGTNINAHVEILSKATNAFSELKYRFQRLNYMNMTQSDKIAKILVTACCLFNILKDLNEFNDDHLAQEAMNYESEYSMQDPESEDN